MFEDPITPLGRGPVLRSCSLEPASHSAEATGFLRVARRLSASAQAVLAAVSGDDAPQPTQPRDRRRAARNPVDAGAGEVVELEALEDREASLQAQLEGLGRHESCRSAEGDDPEDALLVAADTRASKRLRRKQKRVGVRRRGVRVTREQAVELEQEEAWAGRWQAKCEAKCPEGPLVLRRRIPRLVWVMAWSIMHGGEGGARNWLRWARAKFSGVPLARLERAAFCPSGDGSYRYDWTKECARQTIVLGLAMLMLGVSTRRGRRGTYQLCVRGIVIKAFRVLLAVAPGDDGPSKSKLANTWYRGESRPLHQCGLLRRLERVGFLESRQLPAQAQGVEDFEVYRRRDGVPCTSNRYWLTWDEPQPHEDLERLREIGWTLCEREIRRAPLTAAERERVEALEARSRAPD